ncbi:MAG TPA: polysaccharide deacetylase family protein [Beijerinckiaceae bacterium]
MTKPEGPKKPPGAAAPVLPGHGRYPYSPIRGRPAYEWPNGTRLAVYVGLNLEHFAFGEGLGAELAPGGPQPDVLNYAWRDYGNRVGVWRLLDLFDALKWPLSVLVNSSIYGHCPQVMDAVRARGDEVVGHGRTNSERQGVLDEAAERALIQETAAVIAAFEGRPPAGWLGPWISESRVTPDLLAECGYSYLLDWCMDDQPVWLSTRGGRRILSVPYGQELNDIPAIVARKDSAEQFADMIVDNFDEMLEQSAGAPLVMGLALHPYLVGQPYRLRHLRRALEHINGFRDRIWITTAGQIAAHVLALEAAQGRQANRDSEPRLTGVAGAAIRLIPGSRAG